MEHKQCEFSPDCWREAEFALYRTYENGKKYWIQVCDQCEKYVAGENLRRVGGLIRMDMHGVIRDATGKVLERGTI